MGTPSMDGITRVGDLQKSRFARPVAPSQPDLLAFQNRDRGPIEHHLITKPYDKLRVRYRLGHSTT